MVRLAIKMPTLPHPSNAGPRAVQLRQRLPSLIEAVRIAQAAVRYVGRDFPRKKIVCWGVMKIVPALKNLAS